MDLQRFNDKYIGIRNYIKPKERTVYLEREVSEYEMDVICVRF